MLREMSSWELSMWPLYLAWRAEAERREAEDRRMLGDDHEVIHY